VPDRALPLASPRRCVPRSPEAWASAVRTAVFVFVVAIPIVYAAWRLTGNDAWIEIFFRVPGALLLLGLAGTAFRLSVAVVRHFSSGEPLRAAWLLITGASGCDLAGTVCNNVLGSGSMLDPFRYLWRGPVPSWLGDAGLLASGSCRMALLAAGLFYGLRAYRRAGFPGRLAVSDRVLLAGVGLYLVREAWDTAVAIRHGASVTLVEVLQWPADPLLWMLLAEALLLFRCAQSMGKGRISRVWQAFSMGVFLLVVGDVGLWATAYGYLPWPWSSITWCIWVPAAAGFALAPAYQLEAIYRATQA